MTRRTLCLFALGLFAGCGRKGDLRLPGPLETDDPALEDEN